MIRLQVPSSWSTRSRNLTCISMHQRRKRRTFSLSLSLHLHLPKVAWNICTCNLEFSIDLGVQNYHQRNLRLLFKLFVPVVGRLTIFGFCYSKKSIARFLSDAHRDSLSWLGFRTWSPHLPPEPWGLFLSRIPGNQLALPGPGFCHGPKKFTSDHSSVRLTHTLCCPTCMES